MIYGELWQPGRFWPFLLTLDTLRMPHQSNTRNNSIFDLNILVFFKNGLGFSLVLRCGSFCVGGSAFNICSSPVFHSSMSSLPIHHHPPISSVGSVGILSVFFPTIATCAGESGAGFPFLLWYYFSFLFFHVSIAHWSIPWPSYVPTIARCLWPAGEPGVHFLALSCPFLVKRFLSSFFFLLEDCFCIFLKGEKRFLVLDRFVRQRVYNYGHDMYINNTYWPIETCLFVCNVGIYIYIYF